ncbi:MAG: winged helix-turn-helix transcriptional regulator [Bryobacterales bacterium]|nr:winged helix-turn-helix transcriptional regulator [Bryobacterales bacterium]
MTAAETRRLAKLLAEPVRLEILSRVARAGAGGHACADLVAAIDLTPATVSHHMKELIGAGLVLDRREGKYHYYSVNRARWQAYLKSLAALVPPES